jgi:hypothetical protein
MGPLYIKFDNIKTAHVPLFQVLKSIDHSITNFYKDNLKKIQENPMFGDEIEGLFCFKKYIKGGHYIYHLFPHLDLNLIENQDLMQTFDRSEHIHKALQAWEEQQETTPTAGSLSTGLKVLDPTNDETKDPQEMKLIYMTWIILWCATFSYQDQIEQQFRVNQLLQVMIKLKGLLQSYKEKEELLMNLVLTTVKFARYKQSKQIYDKHRQLFEPTQIDFRIAEMIDTQKRQDIEFEGTTQADSDLKMNGREELKVEAQDSGNRIDSQF